VDGLADLYLASGSVLEVLPEETAVSEVARRNMLSGLPSGMRYPVTFSSLAQLGLDAQKRPQAQPFVTQSAENGQLRIENSPAELQALARTLTPLDIKRGQTTRVRLDIKPEGDAFPNKS
jgi:hypothetical protein